MKAITTTEIKAAWTKLIEVHVSAGFDITRLVFDKPSLKSINLAAVIDQIQRIEVEYLERYPADQFSVYNKHLADLKNRYLTINK
jgi:hypothetical protein